MLRLSKSSQCELSRFAHLIASTIASTGESDLDDLEGVKWRRLKIGRVLAAISKQIYAQYVFADDLRRRWLNIFPANWYVWPAGGGWYVATVDIKYEVAAA